MMCRKNIPTLMPWLVAITFGCAPVLADPPAATAVTQAIVKGMNFVLKSSIKYHESPEIKCFTCHHGTAPLKMLQKIGELDSSIQDHYEVIRQRKRVMKTIMDEFGPKKEVMIRNLRQGKIGAGEVATVSSALDALRTLGEPASDMTDAMVDYLIKQSESTNGHWEHTIVARPPLEGSSFDATALSLEGLLAFKEGRLDPKRHPDEDLTAVRAKIESAIEGASKWLKSEKAQTTQDRVTQLYGLRLANGPGIDEQELNLAKELLDLQHRDGSWGRNPGDTDDDAYSTASVLLAVKPYLEILNKQNAELKPRLDAALH